MLGHFLYNAIAITIIYILHSGGQSIKEAVGDHQSSWTGVLVLPIVIGLMILFKKNSPKPPESSEGKNEALRGTPFY